MREEGEQETEEELSLHSIVNIKEARVHAQALNRALNIMAHTIEEGEIEETMKDTIATFKDMITKIMLGWKRPMQ